MATENYRIIFDGTCGFCNKTLLFLANRDKNEAFLFISNLSPEGRRELEDRKLVSLNSKTMIIFDANKVYTKGQALKLIVSKIPALKWLSYLLWIPTIFWDFAYNLVAANRYALGKNACAIPAPEIRSKFIM